ncbi:hypothetical protein O3M35_005721 [Rhynocoris fuscipes]|uniref:Uncharacterized protein n=1 Tax=Rhynocoris fuscipes TaxID=488301 RepID=A0AAW1DR85_9HEMI
MERQAFTVLPPLSPRLPPPPKTPASSRVAPRSVAHRDKNAFVILAEVGDHGPSGRSSPFRGRGFRAPSPQNSRIPVPSGKSAPSSPAKNKSSVTNGKSAPSTPSKKATTNGQASAKKRTESPSKVPVSKTNSPQVSPTKETQKKVAGKPPLAKNNATSRNSKAPQPAKRSEQSTRPTPTARTRLNNKPISTQNHRLTQNRTENKNRIAGNGTDISATSKRDNGNENNTSKVINKEETKVHAEVEVKTDSSNGNNNNNISVVTSNPSSNPEEIHKISIEINSENGAKRDNINETVVVINEISGQNSKTKEESKGDTEKKNLKSQNIDENDNNDKKSKTEQVTVLTNDANIKSISKNGKLDIKDLHANNINSKEAVELSKMKETVVDIEDDMITAITDAITNIDENSIERIPDKDATLVEWTTKQPLELAKPQPDVIPTDPAVVSIEETTEETVQGPPEVEVEAGNHTVTFRYILVIFIYI